jgi:PAS domain S-box-containing protein
VNTDQPADPIHIAEVLLEKIPVILEEWLCRVKLGSSIAAEKSDAYLIDHVPLFLRSVAHILRDPEDPTNFADAVENARAHGLQRSSWQAFRVTGIAFEYAHLRECLISAITIDSHLAFLQKAHWFDRLIATAVSAATEEFVLRRYVGQTERLLKSESALGPVHEKKLGTDLEQVVEFLQAPMQGAGQLGGKRAAGTPGQRQTSAEFAGFPVTQSAASILAAERAAASAIENLRQIADAVSTIIVQVDREFRYVFVNRAYEEWFDRQSHQLVGKAIQSVVEPQFYLVLKEYLNKALAGECLSLEYLLPRATSRVSQAADGESRVPQAEHVLLCFVPVQNHEHEITGVVITAQSIQQQKMAELQASLSRQELASVFAQAPTPIALLLGPEYTFTLANPPYQELIGRDPVGLKLTDVFVDGEADPFLRLLDGVYKTGIPYVGRELPFQRKKNAVPGVNATGTVPGFEELRIDLAYHPFFSPSGEVQGILAFVYDVTDQYRARQIVEASESRLRTIFANTSVGFAVTRVDGRFFEVNRRYSEITGYSENELVSMSIEDLLVDDDAKTEHTHIRALTTGTSESVVTEQRLRRKSGETAWTRTGLSLVTDEQGDQFIVRVSEDVTLVHEAEVQKRESEARFGLLADSMPQIVWTARPDGDLDYFNRVWFDYSGTAFEDNRGSGWAKAVHPEDLPAALVRWEKSLRTGENYETEFRLRAASGEYRWHVARATCSRDASGAINKWYGTNTDIHDVKVLMHQLERARAGVEIEQRKFKSIFSASSTSMAVLQGPEFIYEVANASYQQLFCGRDLIGKPLLKALPELAGQEFPAHIEKVFRTGETYQDREARAFLQRTPDGPLEERYFEQSYSRMVDETGAPYGVFIHAIEVTERVLARRSLEETAERFRIAVELANMGTWEVNPQSNIVLWSKRTNELFGVPLTEKIPLEAAIANIHPNDRPKVEAAIRAAMDPTGNGNYDIQYRILHEGVETRWLSLLGKAYFEDTAQGRVCRQFSGTVLDVTERVVAEAALREAKERAELANEAKSSFLANMSHEIRTPLGAIMGFVSLIKDEGLDAQTLHQYVSVIERNSVQLMRIIDDILDLSKVEAGMMLIEHIDFSLVELLSDFASLMGFRAREKGIVFELKAKSELPDIVNSDPTRIRQILTNIAGNAIKFTESGSVQLRVSYVDENLIFEVEDSGRGISPTQRELLFQPFAQGDPSTTRKYGGTGLGLVLTRRLSEALGGGFNLDYSTPGKGSQFTAKVKVQLPERSKLVRALGFATELIRNGGVSGRLKNLRVLLVEDSLDNQALFSIYLNRAGAAIDIASDGAYGVEMAMSGQYDVVLMDVQMPIMDGITAVRKLRSLGNDLPIIALTAHAMKEERLRCLEAGYTGFLSKPIQRSDLVEALVKFCSIEA